MARSADLSPDEILPPKTPMRDEIDAQAFAELVSSIRKNGVLQPLVVTPEGDRYRLMAGFRRWLAAQEAGLLTVPVVIREATELQRLEVMLEENLIREGTSPLKEGEIFAKMADEHGLTTEETAQLIHKSASYVHSRLRALRAPADVQEALRAGRVTLSVALELTRCVRDVDRTWLLSHAMDRGATVDTVRRWVAEANLRAARTPEGPAIAEGQLPAPAPAVMMTVCEWGRHEVAMDQTLTFRVCGPHYTFLQDLREAVTREDAARRKAEGSGG